ncbi:MAG: DUF1802 family protein [Akkermansiaceae bacterium]|jgi:hypothetical protein|nr:DUF1802 family protein [Akkermansiaceae bacterium]MCU0777362.1 DUF1802 family protein [Akkermansiaceae bacterium]
MPGSIAFKEWQVVCDALATGRQSILLRKGGIHEGRRGFSFAHDAFFLFPTRFHAQGGQVREGELKSLPEWQPGDVLRVTHHAEALWAVTLTDWQKVAALEPHHIYSEATVRERFDWEGKGMASGSIHVALVRVRELADPWELVYQPSFGGCRSWISLPEPPAGWRDTARPVLDDAAFACLHQLDL